MAPSADRPWIAAHEGYYGPPLTIDARGELVAFLASCGYDAYVYSPKDDPYQRARWRDPYPDDARRPLEELVAAGAAAGVEVGLTISPGLDWRVDDPGELDALTAKVLSLAELGVTTLAINWDDVPGEGSEIGRAHAEAVTEVVRRVDSANLRWMSCPVDYAVESPTPYLRAFAAALGEGIHVLWTGPQVVTRRLTATHVRDLAEALDRPLLFAENFPVNDLGMAPVLHLGPAPDRSPEAMTSTGGVLVNFMSLPRASRIGLELTARAWRDPGEDRETAWREVVAAHAGIGPLARACRSWWNHPGPDPELAAWAASTGPDDTRLREFLEAGCRDGLDPATEAEVEPWLEAWEQEATVMGLAISILEADRSPSIEEVGLMALAWQRARRRTEQAFGTRFAIYPGAHRRGGRFVATPGAVVDGDNLTDRLVRRALAHQG